jgi:zinc/manganese transport system substrate-binding protein
MNHLFADHLVRVFCYNAQVVDSLTASLRATAIVDHIPVVAVYETLPTGDTYQQWMEQETSAIAAAVTHDQSTLTLP